MVTIFLNGGIMNNIIKEIYDGWKNYTFKNPQIEETAKKRIDVCVNCKDPKTGKLGITNRKTCRYCGCFIPAKTRSIKSKCPLNKW